MDEELNEIEKSILIILYIADVCNYQGGALTEDEIKIILNYTLFHQIDLFDIKEKTKNDIEAGIDFLHNALNRN